MKKNPLTNLTSRLLLILLALAMVFSLVACGDDDSEYVDDDKEDKKTSGKKDDSTKETEATGGDETQNTEENTNNNQEQNNQQDNQPVVDVAAVKAEAIQSADVLAGTGDYLGAIAVIDEAEKTVGADPELTAKKELYGKLYISATVDTARAQKKSKEYDAAITLLNDALTRYPGNADLTAVVGEVEAAKAMTAQVQTANPNQNPTMPKTGADQNVTGGATKAAAAQVQTENINHGSFTTSGREDWYCFTTSSNYSAYNIEFLNNSISTSVHMHIYDAYEKELGYADYLWTGETGYVDLILTPNTTFFIRVSRSGDDKLGNYQFSVSEKICDAGADKTNAFLSDLDTLYTKSFESRYIEDWFTFTATDNYATYQFSLINNSINDRVYLTVYDEYDTMLGEISAWANESALLDLLLSPNKKYTIKFSRYYGDKLGNYQFSILEMYCDGGKNKEEAFALNIGETYNKIADTSLEEWYSYTFTETGVYTLTLTNNNVDTTVYATVYDVLGTELGSVHANKSDTTQESLEIQAGTVLYIKITRYDEWRFGNYTMTVTEATPETAA